MTLRDPLWENVRAYVGPIRHYDAKDWKVLQQDDILEIEVEVVYKGRVYTKSQLLDREDVRQYPPRFAEIVDFIVSELDKKLKRRRAREGDGASRSSTPSR